MSGLSTPYAPERLSFTTDATPVVHKRIHNLTVEYVQVRAVALDICAIAWGAITEATRGAWWNTLNPGLTTKANGGLSMVSLDHIAPPHNNHQAVKQRG